MDYNEILSYFFQAIPNYQKYGSAHFKPGLEKIQDLLDAVGNPETELKFIHVAGTNGKGSTCSFLHYFLSESGYKTGLFTSPHLFDFRERIKIGNDLIPKEEVEIFYADFKADFDELEPSFFELTFALALWYFKRQKTDICVIETGLGGRLDATNIIDPEICSITNIGMDHTEFLGDTLEKIAAEKGGIIKEKVPVVLGEMEKSAEEILIEIAEEKNAPVIPLSTFSVEFFSYQQSNLNLSKTILNHLKEEGWDQINLELSARDLQVFGRFQTLQENPKIIIDVAHNQQGFEALFAQKELIEAKNLHILFGGTKEKDVNLALNHFPKNAHVNFTTFSSPRSLSKEDFEKQHTIAVYQIFEDPINAFESVKKQLGQDDTFLICGSFYLIADLKPLLDSQS